MYLGIEIGGTKLQLGVSAGDGNAFVDFVRCRVDPEQGAKGILDQIKQAGQGLIHAHQVERVVIGFGGPVDASSGRVIKSHQINGWDDFPLALWCEEQLGKCATLYNDCDVAAVAEANFGAGRMVQNRSPEHDADHVVFYVTVGTGIGGGLVINGRLYGQHAPAASEIGHLRCGPLAALPEQTVESVAAGPAIAAAAAAWAASDADSEDAQQLQGLCGGKLELLTTQHIAVAARTGNMLARQAVANAIQTLGWAIAQVSTLLAPQVVVVGGGVSLMGEGLFYGPLRDAVTQYQFPPLTSSMVLVPPKLGEEVVVHGAAHLARLN